jgi:hypothetical protein
MVSGRRRRTGKLGETEGAKINRLVAANLKVSLPGMYGDGGGLWLQVTALPNGLTGRSWIYRYTFNGKTREMGLGSLTKVGLAQARQAAKQCWEMVHPVSGPSRTSTCVARRRHDCGRKAKRDIRAMRAAAHLSTARDLA